MTDTIFTSIGKEILNEDNRATDSPIYMVQVRTRHYIAPAENLPDELSGSEWILEDGSYTANEEESAALDFADSICDEAALSGWVKMAYLDVYAGIQPFFTESAAREYIHSNEYRLIRPSDKFRVYVVSGYRNPQWTALRKIFVDSATAPTSSGSQA